MKVQVEVDDEMVDQIVRNELRWHRDNAKDFFNVGKEDKKYIKKLAPALDIVCEYFGVDKNERIHNANKKTNR